ncbi:MAG: Ig-like domain-containing protein [Bdellovibrionota bacterium]
MANKLTTSIIAIQLLISILVSSCGAPPLPEDIESANQTTPIEIVSSDYSGTIVTAASYVSISNCTSNYTYNSSALSPVNLSTIGLALNDSCTFNFQRLVVSGTTYYGISGYMTINSSADAALRFSSTQGGSTPAIYVNAKTTNVYPVGSSPSFTFTVMTDSQFANAVATGAFSTVNTSSSSNMGVGTISISVSGTPLDPSTLTIRGTQTYTATSTNADDSANATAVSWSSSNTSVATINSTTGVATGVAAGSTKIIATITDSLGTHSTSVGLTVRTPYLYVTTKGTSTSTSLYKCSLNPANGAIVSCSAFYTTATNPLQISLIQNSSSAAPSMYLSGYASGIFSFVPINTDGTQSRTGWTTAASASSPQGMAFSGSYAFITTLGAQTTIQSCPVNSSGTFGTCTTAATGFTAVQYLSTTTINGTSYLIVVDRNSGNRLKVCQISGGTLSCGSFYPYNASTYPYNDPSAAVVVGSTLYVSGYASKIVVRCTLSGTTISSCADSGAGTFGNRPNGFAVNGNEIYVSEWLTNGSAYGLWKCTMNSNGSIPNTCVIFNTFPYGPRGMAVY